ncbi:MAG: zinc ribbon domain-containing protein [Bacteroidaceae bacterium]|nr:zinc ribbon domain-containing protein [Bacteroidaceae bacterium]
MALIKCTHCGHMISDKAVKCPKCGTVTNEKRKEGIPSAMMEKQMSPEEASLKQSIPSTERKRNLIWWILSSLVLISIILVVLWMVSQKDIGGEGASSVTSKGTETSLFHLDDGLYCYEGVWNEDAPQDCQLMFRKEGERLTDCVYTNLKWNAEIPLKGELREDSIFLNGENGTGQLVLVLGFSDDSSVLHGYGIDEVHHGTRRIVRLTKREDAEEVLIKKNFINYKDVFVKGEYEVSINKQLKETLERRGYVLQKEEVTSEYIEIWETSLEIHHYYLGLNMTYDGYWRSTTSPCNAVLLETGGMSDIVTIYFEEEAELNQFMEDARHDRSIRFEGVEQLSWDGNGQLLQITKDGKTKLVCECFYGD